MRKTGIRSVTTVSLLVLLNFQLLAQDNEAQDKKRRFYFNITFDAGIPFGDETIGTNYTRNQNEEIEEIIKGTYGAGIGASASFGYRFCKYVSVEISPDFMYGYKYKFNYPVINQFPFVLEETIRGIYLSGNAGCRFWLPIKKVQLNSTLGIVVPLYNVLKHNLEGSETFFAGSTPFFELHHSLEITTTGLHNPGVYVGLGAEVPITNLLCVYIELRYTSLSFVKSKAEVTKAEQTLTDLQTGETASRDILGTYSKSQKEIEYVDRIDYNEIQDPDKPSKMLSSSVPMSALEFKVGINLKF